MDTKLNILGREKERSIPKEQKSVGSSRDDYRAAVQNLIQKEVGSMIDEEIRAAAHELVEEQRKAIREAVEEHKLVIRQVVEEEKVAIRARVEELRRSIIRLGMG